MSDNLKPDDRKRTMQAVKSKGTRLEKRLFAMLAGMGIGGWKRNVKSIIGKPDVAFPNQKIVIFVDGCFWHGCLIAIENCLKQIAHIGKERLSAMSN